MICDKWLHIYGNKLGTGINCEWVDAVNVVEVVRCKDCKHWLKTTLTTVDGEPVYDCPLLNEWGDEDGYCSYGERADNEIH